MLGELLEYAFVASPIAPSAAFFRALGFVDLHAGDILAEPYLPVSNGAVVIGMHDRPDFEATITFVRPQLEMYLRALRRVDVELEFSELGEDRFHRAGFRDPNGILVTLLEARTFSPPPEIPALVSAVGRFVEFSIPTHSLDISKRFWESLGLSEVAHGQTPTPWIRLGGHGLTIGFHAGLKFRPGLCFGTADLSARMQYLQACGFKSNEAVPFADANQGSAVLRSPDDHSIYMIELAALN